MAASIFSGAPPIFAQPAVRIKYVAAVSPKGNQAIIVPEIQPSRRWPTLGVKRVAFGAITVHLPGRPWDKPGAASGITAALLAPVADARAAFAAVRPTPSPIWDPCLALAESS